MKKLLLSLVFVAAVVLGSVKTSNAIICWTVYCSDDSIHHDCINAPSGWWANLSDEAQTAAAEMVADYYCQ